MVVYPYASVVLEYHESFGVHIVSHVLDATYENGMLKLERPLPLQQQEKVRVTVESLSSGRHGLLDIPPVSLGSILSPSATDDDLLAEMLEGRP